jgi:uncharacterized protein (DUF3820 family)
MPEPVTTSTAEGAPVFTQLERKLIALALDEAAAVGEVQNSAVMLIQSLRRRGMRPEALILGSELRTPSLSHTPLERARRFRMPFGRHQGRQLQAIEENYLRWCLRECRCLSLGLREAIRLVLSAGGAS